MFILVAIFVVMRSRLFGGVLTASRGPICYVVPRGTVARPGFRCVFVGRTVILCQHFFISTVLNDAILDLLGFGLLWLVSEFLTGFD